MGKIKYIIIPLILIGGISFFVWNRSCQNRSNLVVIIEKPTDLLEKPDRKDPLRNKVISKLNPGIKAEVIHVRYSKEFMFYKIKTEDGLIGYIMHGDDFKVIESNKKP